MTKIKATLITAIVLILLSIATVAHAEYGWTEIYTEDARHSWDCLSAMGIPQNWKEDIYWETQAVELCGMYLMEQDWPY